MNAVEPPVRRAEQLTGRRLLGIVLILGGLGWILFELFSQGTIAGINLQLARVDSVQAIPAQRFVVSRVEVTGVNDQIILQNANGPEVVLSGERIGFGWEANAAANAAAKVNVAVEQRDDTLYININHQLLVPFNFGRNPYARLEIALPPNVEFNVSSASGSVTLDQTTADGTVTTISGNVSADSTEGDLTINTTSGTVELRNHRGALQFTAVSGKLLAIGPVTGLVARTTSGDVTVQGAPAAVKITTISGNVVVDTTVASQVAVDTTNGTVTFTGPLSDGKHHIRTISGDIAISLVAPNVDLDIQTKSGFIDLPDQLAAQSVDRRLLTATLGEGGAKLSVSSISGNIRLQVSR